jgi:hypothetical protein
LDTSFAAKRISCVGEDDDWNQDNKEGFGKLLAEPFFAVSWWLGACARCATGFLGGSLAHRVQSPLSTLADLSCQLLGTHSCLLGEAVRPNAGISGGRFGSRQGFLGGLRRPLAQLDALVPNQCSGFLTALGGEEQRDYRTAKSAHHETNKEGAEFITI